MGFLYKNRIISFSVFSHSSFFHTPAYKSKSALWIAKIPHPLEKCTLQEEQAHMCNDLWVY